jgi:electron transfer flavoprotein alpha subunit
VNNVLVIAEHDGHRLSAATARCVQCALGLGESQIVVAVFGHQVAAVARDAAVLTGVARVLMADAPGFEHPLAAVLAPAIAAIARDYTHVFGPSTTFGKDLMPRVAALLDVPAVSDVMAVESPTRFRRPIYAGNAIVTVEVNARTPGGCHGAHRVLQRSGACDSQCRHRSAGYAARSRGTYEVRRGLDPQG